MLGLWELKDQIIQILEQLLFNFIRGITSEGLRDIYIMSQTRCSDVKYEIISIALYIVSVSFVFACLCTIVFSLYESPLTELSITSLYNSLPFPEFMSSMVDGVISEL